MPRLPETAARNKMIKCARIIIEVPLCRLGEYASIFIVLLYLGCTLRSKYNTRFIWRLLVFFAVPNEIAWCNSRSVHTLKNFFLFPSMACHSECILRPISPLWQALFHLFGQSVTTLSIWHADLFNPSIAGALPLVSTFLSRIQRRDVTIVEDKILTTSLNALLMSNTTSMVVNPSSAFGFGHAMMLLNG